jgi:hypothetical protein
MERIGSAMASGETVVFVAILSFSKVIVKNVGGSVSWTPCAEKASPCTTGRPGSAMMVGGRLTFLALLG